MKIRLSYSHLDCYSPLNRHKNLRQRILTKAQVFDLLAINIEQFPVAFITHELHRDSNSDGYFYLNDHSRTYRTYNGKLFRQLVYCADRHEIEKYIEVELDRVNPKSNAAMPKDTVISNIKEYLNDFILINETEIWRTTPEPIYEINYNFNSCPQKSISLFIEESAKSPTPYQFNALQKEDALSLCKEEAEKDNLSIGPCAHIEVLMPKMVQCDPQAEYVMSQLVN